MRTPSHCTAPCMCVYDLPQRNPRCNVYFYFYLVFLRAAIIIHLRQRRFGNRNRLFRTVPVFSIVFFFFNRKNRARKLVNPSRPRVGARDVVEEDVAARQYRIVVYSVGDDDDGGGDDGGGNDGGGGGGVDDDVVGVGVLGGGGNGVGGGGGIL